MMQFRTLILASVMLPCILSSAAKDKYMEVKAPKRETSKLADFDIPQQQDTNSGVAPKAEEIPTCLLCVCLSGSVYCEEVSPDMSTVPTLPMETGYLYARFNKIRKISNKDFADMASLRVINLSGNLIAEIDDGAFSKLPNLEELILTENRLTKLPMLPTKLLTFNANFNQLKTQGVKATAFKKLTRLAYLYLGNNELTAVPQLPESLHVVHLHNNKIATITDETFCKGNTSYYIRTNLRELNPPGSFLMEPAIAYRTINGAIKH
ncbi:uncharacterized protein V6R79_004932 [Siganus canaliculatus]